MPIVDRIVPIATGDTLDVMAQDQYQYIPFESAKLDFGFKAQFTAAAQFAKATGLQVRVFSGSDLLQAPSNIIIEASPFNSTLEEEGTGKNKRIIQAPVPNFTGVPVSTALRMQFPYDFLLTDVGVQGERIGVSLVNTSGQEVLTRSVVRIMPAAAPSA